MEKKYYILDKHLNMKLSSFPEPRPIKKKNKMDLANYANIGYYLVTPLLFGVFFGLYLDGRLGTNYLVVIGIVIGSIGTFYNLFKILKQ